MPDRRECIEDRREALPLCGIASEGAAVSSRRGDPPDKDKPCRNTSEADLRRLRRRCGRVSHLHVDSVHRSAMLVHEDIRDRGEATCASHVLSTQSTMRSDLSRQSPGDHITRIIRKRVVHIDGVPWIPATVLHLQDLAVGRHRPSPRVQRNLVFLTSKLLRFLR